MSARATPVVMALVVLAAAVAAGGGWYLVQQKAVPVASEGEPQGSAARVGVDLLQLAPEQVKELDVGMVAQRGFEQRREAIGVIDFNQDRSVQVFSPYQGRIGKVSVRAGEDVVAGQLLFTVLIPDLPQAAATLISAAGNLRAANETLKRARALAETQSIPQKELSQNMADQQAADAAWRAARVSLSLFGLTATQIDEIETGRKVDNEMPVLAPFAGRVVARSAAPGLLVQPGSGNAVVTVSDLRSLWMVASVPESELGAYRLGQPMSVRVQAYPGKTFSGKVSYIADSSDPTTRRIVVRADVEDPKGLLRAQMLANFTIQVGDVLRSAAVPANALARESNGSVSAWVTDDGVHFKRREVSTGLTQDGFVQILKGLAPGDRIARDKALFLSNLYLISNP